MSYALEVYLPDERPVLRANLLAMLEEAGWEARLRPTGGALDAPWLSEGEVADDLLAAIRLADTKAGPLPAMCVELTEVTRRVWWKPWAAGVTTREPKRKLVTLNLLNFFERNDAEEAELVARCDKLASCEVRCSEPDAATTRALAAELASEQAAFMLAALQVVTFTSSAGRNGLTFEFQASVARLLAASRGGLCYDPQEGRAK